MSPVVLKDLVGFASGMPVLAAVLLCGGKGSRMLAGGVTTHKPLLEIGDEICILTSKNEHASDRIYGLNEEQEKLAGASEKLVKLNNLKGKITQKVATITKEHKFFTDNTVCPTCTQDIEEEFRVNRIADVQDKAKELKKGFKDLEETIKLETERERHFTQLSKEITKLNHDISQNNTRISLSQRQIGELEDEVQTITERIKNRNTEHEKLAEFKENLQKTIEDLADRREEINHYRKIR